MKDRNGREIVVGALAVITRNGMSLNGKTGKVTRLEEECDAFEFEQPEPGVALASRNQDVWQWGTWCRPDDIAVVPGSGLPA